MPASWHWSEALHTTGLAPVQAPARQVSVWVQALPSSQVRAGPATHTPAEHWSFVVQALPSSHEPATFVCTQPLAGSQESPVQTLPSLQLGAGPPTHVPPEQVSLVVQALPSSQDAVLL